MNLKFIFIDLYVTSLTITFFSEPRACVSCTVSCTGVELEKPLISNLRLIVLVIKIIVQTCMSLQNQRSNFQFSPLAATHFLVN